MCVGAPKCGTTTLYDILRQHPEIYLTSFKEPHFFDIDKNYLYGKKYYIKEYYSSVKNETAIGEFTPSYLLFEKAINRIYDCFGGSMKFIILMRNPIERAYSQYLHARRDQLEMLSFEDALKEERLRLKKNIAEGNDLDYMRYSYIEGGLYGKHLQYISDKYGKKNIKVLIFEEFVSDAERWVNEVLDFLGVNYGKIKLNYDVQSNVAGTVKYPMIKSLLYNRYLRKMFKSILRSKKSRQCINMYIENVSNKPLKKEPLNRELKKSIYIRYFYSDVLLLEELLGRDVRVWKDAILD